MRRYLAVGSLLRGAIDPPEPVADAVQWQLHVDDERQRVAIEEVLRQRATRRYQAERDPEQRIGERVGHVKRMVDLAMKTRCA